MPRTARATPGGYCFHVLNRSNGRQTIFHGPQDYGLFTRLMAEASERALVDVFAWCLMPNHFHLLLRPHGDRDLARWMQWLMTVQVRRHRARHGGDGHLWQGRFKAFPVQDDAYLFTVVRYIERNPVRAGLVDRADHWRWSSLRTRLGMSAGPALASLPLPGGLDEQMNEIESADALDALRRSVNKGAPYGSASWVQATAEQLGLESTLRGVGRPRKAELKR